MRDRDPHWSTETDRYTRRKHCLIKQDCTERNEMLSTIQPLPAQVREIRQTDQRGWATMRYVDGEMERERRTRQNTESVSETSHEEKRKENLLT